jgi:MFS family permease
MVDGDRTVAAAAISAGGYGILLAACGLLPGYAQSGYAGMALMVGLRALTGIFLAGQVVAFGPALIHRAAPHRRWLIGSLLPTGSPASYIVASLLTLGVMAVAPVAGAGSPYLEWGWRVAFWAGAAISLGCFLLALGVRGSLARPAAAPSPVPAAPRRQHGRAGFLSILVLLSGIQIVLSTSVATLPGYLVQVGRYPAGSVTWAVIAAYTLMAFAYISTGWLSHRLGASRVFIGWAIVASGLSVGTLNLIWSFAPGTHLGLALGGLVVVTVVALSVAGFMHTYTVESVDPALLATSYGAARSLAECVPVLSGLYIWGLSALFGEQAAPAVLLAIGGMAVLAGALLLERLSASSPATLPSTQGNLP